MAKVIAIDYDDTYTADPALWDSFIEAAKARGHMVVCVTARDERVHGKADIGIEVFYACGQPKAAFMESAGLMPDIWIDDRPDLIGGYSFGVAHG